MSKNEAFPFGVFTLVSYVPDPLGRFIDELRRSLPGEAFAQSHITLVPPRPLNVPLQAASEFAQSTLNRFSAFEVVLGDVHRFPETNLLYLDLVLGQGEIKRLHDALNKDVLAHEERFEFRPHLTVGGPLLESEIRGAEERVREQWLARNGDKGFQVLEIVALWSDPALDIPEWTRVWTRRLGQLARATDQTY